MLWISWLVVCKCLFFTTNNNTENIYWNYKGKITSLLKNRLQESQMFGFFIIGIIHY